MLLHRQIVIVAGGKAIEHFLYGNSTLPCHHILVEIGHRLKFVGYRLEFKFTARVLFHFAAFVHVNAEFLREQFAYFFRHLFDGMLFVVAFFANTE